MTQMTDDEAIEIIGRINQKISNDAEWPEERERNKLTSEWQPIETAPKDGSRILVYIAKANSCDTQHRAGKMHVSFWRKKEKHWGCGNDKYFPVTHWLPLPAKPEGIEKKTRR